MNLNSFELFGKSKATLKMTSKDDSDPHCIKYMIDADTVVINFDEVKRLYTNGFGVSEDYMQSVDALTSIKDEICLIEFKNGKVSSKEVKGKIKDSLLMLTDIMSTNTSFVRQHGICIVVYNEEKNPIPNQYTKGIPQYSESRSYISKRILQLGRKEIILFDLENYGKLFFKEIHTFTVEEFEGYRDCIASI